MRIQQLFSKDIFRPINGVVKADQLDESSVWQELDEFVVTHELGHHLDRFFQRYTSLTATDDPEAAGRIGVWISGFFGSGKSHFIKVLSYLLANHEHRYKGETRRALDFFSGKLDTLLFADIRRALAQSADVILFNIDSKADHRQGRDAILAVFLKVFNQMLDFCGEHAHIAHFERYLRSKNRLDAFHAAFRDLTGNDWLAERDAYHFHRDQVIEALAQTLGQSTESCEKWIDGAEDTFAITVENFAGWVRDYLDTKEKGHRIVFLVDEVGQFIGSDTHLMLNLQTIIEELGIVCGGRAWVVVTSQEDIDAVLGDIGLGRANDFSKIQGRFKTRLSLSSANVDEVIQKRLLTKNEEARKLLEAEFARKGDILRNQLSFTNVGMTFRPLKSADDFVANYPFVPYQFRLLQKIFESIRKAGATGLHLAQGERSLLDAFQAAAKAIAEREIGEMVPLYLFYPSIESFLESSVKRTIDQARETVSLEPFDIHILELLFLIRYVDEMRGNIDNLVTLCLAGIDGDRLELRRAIEAGLQRLEKETLISRNGENYFFLTNEERDISREIKSVELASGDDTRLLGELIFSEVLRDQRKHRYSVNKMDFVFNRFCDRHAIGNRQDGALVVSVVTPLSEEHGLYGTEHCVLESTREGGQLLIVLRDEPSLGPEVRTCLRTEKYLRTRNDGSLPASTLRIHRDRSEENNGRRARLVVLAGDLFSEAQFFANGQKLKTEGASPVAALDQALGYLIENTFTKMGYLKTLTENPLPEIQAILRSDDIAQQALELDLPKSNPQAIEDLRRYIELASKASQQIVLSELIEKRYANRPYGWPKLEVVLLLARLYAVGEIRFQMAGTPIERPLLYEAISAASKWPKVVVHRRQTTQPADLQRARQLGKQIFSEMGPDGEESLFTFLRAKAQDWTSDLSGFKALADTGRYPGQEAISNAMSLLRSVLAADESNKFLSRFLERGDELLELVEPFHDLKNFYSHQRASWENLQTAVKGFELNRLELEADEIARGALRRMHEILASRSPYAFIRETTELIRQVQEVNQNLIAAARAEALAEVEIQGNATIRDLAHAPIPLELRADCLTSFENLRSRIGSLESLAHLAQAQGEARRQRDAILARLEQLQAPAKASATDSSQLIKPRSIIEPALLVRGQYLETADDVEEFLTALREALESAIAASSRIEIR
jgi:hypothetical protein